MGRRARICRVGGEGELRLRLLDMGLTRKTLVTVTEAAPMGDPIRIDLRGYCLTLRLADAAFIEVEL
ncbi:MAG TPA: FeoA family protein [Eubacteriales bacterium]|nr:FeoA family protein [Clostridia bacterium]HRV73005.1 FeoA family protein [Eubacteriales bacterium]